jgi:hypothetical protein
MSDSLAKDAEHAPVMWLPARDGVENPQADVEALRRIETLWRMMCEARQAPSSDSTL